MLNKERTYNWKSFILEKLNKHPKEILNAISAKKGLPEGQPEEPFEGPPKGPTEGPPDTLYSQYETSQVWLL